MPRPVSPTSVEQRIVSRLARLASAKGLRLIAAADFATVGSRAAVDVALHRIAKTGKLRRLTTGLYYVPIIHPLLGELKPSAETFVAALEKKHHIRTQPSGAAAANALGFSEQVPMRLVYLTNGPSRRFRVGKQEIVLKQTTPKNMATAGRLSGLLIQALRYMGKRNTNEATIARFRNRIGPDERRKLLADTRFAPAWIANAMRAVAAEDDS